MHSAARAVSGPVGPCSSMRASDPLLAFWESLMLSHRVLRVASLPSLRPITSCDLVLAVAVVLGAFRSRWFSRRAQLLRRVIDSHLLPPFRHYIYLGPSSAHVHLGLRRRVRASGFPVAARLCASVLRDMGFCVSIRTCSPPSAISIYLGSLPRRFEPLRDGSVATTRVYALVPVAAARVSD